MMTTYNVFSAAIRAGIKRVVWASSETIYGLPFTRTPPVFAPVTEDHPLAPESGYALAKTLVAKNGERGEPLGIPARGSWVYVSQYLRRKRLQTSPRSGPTRPSENGTCGAGVDSRDVAQACRLGLGADVAGADNFTIAAADTLMDEDPEPGADGIGVSRGVPVDPRLGPFDTLLSIEKARRVLVYAPQYAVARVNSRRDASPILGLGGAGPLSPHPAPPAARPRRCRPWCWR